MKVLNQRGISLLSLIITIIVLLIITRVTIINISGKNSVINKAQDSKLTAEQRKNEEQLEEILIKYNLGNSIEKDLKNYLQDELGIVETGANILKQNNVDGTVSYVIKNYFDEDVVLVQDADGFWGIKNL